MGNSVVKLGKTVTLNLEVDHLLVDGVELCLCFSGV